MPTVRILVVDDHATVRRTMCSLLSQDSTLDVICETASGEEAVIKACEHQPDLVLLDRLHSKASRCPLLNDGYVRLVLRGCFWRFIRASVIIFTIYTPGVSHHGLACASDC
jgi:DNA-binding NarL/FixJ family response regulator